MHQRGDRGASVSVWFSVSVVAVLMVAGLAVDGGAQTAAARRAETTAQAAARAGVDAGATSRLAGRGVDSTAVLTAARSHLAAAGVPGDARLEGQQLRVDTHVAAPTTFLSLLGITSLPATGSATARLERR